MHLRYQIFESVGLGVDELAVDELFIKFNEEGYGDGEMLIILQKCYLWKYFLLL